MVRISFGNLVLSFLHFCFLYLHWNNV